MERQTRQRQLIYSIVAGTKCHPDAEWVYAKARESQPHISLGTVYRNLRALQKEGLLETVECEDGIIHFDADTSTHAHTVCSKCNAIGDCFETESIPDMSFEVERVKTVYYGICDKCRDKYTKTLKEV